MERNPIVQTMHKHLVTVERKNQGSEWSTIIPSLQEFTATRWPPAACVLDTSERSRQSDKARGPTSPPTADSNHHVMAACLSACTPHAEHKWTDDPWSLSSLQVCLPSGFDWRTVEESSSHCQEKTFLCLFSVNLNRLKKKTQQGHPSLIPKKNTLSIWFHLKLHFIFKQNANNDKAAEKRRVKVKRLVSSQFPWDQRSWERIVVYVRKDIFYIHIVYVDIFYVVPTLVIHALRFDRKQ